MDTLKQKVDEMQNQTAQDNADDFVHWCIERGMSEADLINVLVKGMAMVGHHQLSAGGAGNSFGAQVKGPEFAMRIEVKRLSDEEFAASQTEQETSH